MGRYGLVINILSGAYLGAMLVSFGLLYWLYSDASSREKIPWNLPLNVQIELVQAINKDDVLQSPRYALKHYRHVLDKIYEAYSGATPSEQIIIPISPEKGGDLHILSSELLMACPPAIANFYIDMLLRYAKTLLARGERAGGIALLKHVVSDQSIFQSLGDAERLAQACRVMGRTVGTCDRISFLQRAIEMLVDSFAGFAVSPQYVLDASSRILDELVASLCELAAAQVHLARETKDSEAKNDLLARLLHIYLGVLRPLVQVRENGVRYPLFDCSQNNVVVLENAVRSHILELLWAQGYKKSATAWGEQILSDVYFDHASEPQLGPILTNTLRNLITMYTELGQPLARARCTKLLQNVEIYDAGPPKLWYASTLARFSNIIYNMGPLGIIVKPLGERFAAPQRLEELHEYDTE